MAGFTVAVGAGMVVAGASVTEDSAEVAEGATDEQEEKSALGLKETRAHFHFRRYTQH